MFLHFLPILEAKPVFYFVMRSTLIFFIKFFLRLNSEILVTFLLVKSLIFDKNKSILIDEFTVLKF